MPAGRLRRKRSCSANGCLPCSSHEPAPKLRDDPGPHRNRELGDLPQARVVESLSKLRVLCVAHLQSPAAVAVSLRSSRMLRSANACRRTCALALYSGTISFNRNTSWVTSRAAQMRRSPSTCRRISS